MLNPKSGLAMLGLLLMSTAWESQGREYRAAIFYGGSMWIPVAKSCEGLPDFDKQQFPDYSAFDVMPQFVLDGNRLTYIAQMRFKKCVKKNDGSYAYDIVSVDVSKISGVGSNYLNHAYMVKSQFDPSTQEIRFQFDLERFLTKDQLALYRQKKNLPEFYSLVELKDQGHLIFQLAKLSLTYSEKEDAYTLGITDFLMPSF